MNDDYIECVELAGKTINSLRIYRDTGDGVEMQIDLADGTSFSCSFCVAPKLEASLIRTGIGAPEILHTYDLD